LQEPVGGWFKDAILPKMRNYPYASKERAKSSSEMPEMQLCYQEIYEGRVEDQAREREDSGHREGGTEDKDAAED